MSKIENCEICGTAFSAFEITCNCHERQDSAFYTAGDGHQVVWEQDGSPFYVVRAGEMRVNAVDENGTAWIIRNTEQLEEFGIENDDDLRKWGNQEVVFDWINNSWFEVWSSEDGNFSSESIHILDEAIGVAKDLSKQFPNGIPA